MTKSERTLLLNGIKQFHSEFIPQFGSGTDEELNAVIDELIANPHFVYVVEEGKGMMIGIVRPYLFNPSKIVAQEIGWYVLPEYRNSRVGISLFNNFEALAQLMGADIILMVSLGSHDVGNYYTKKGYNMQEQFYYKEL